MSKTHSPPAVLELKRDMAACRALHLPWLLKALKGALNIIPQLVLASIAPYIVLTRPAALGFMAQLIAHIGHVQFYDATTHPQGRLSSLHWHAAREVCMCFAR